MQNSQYCTTLQSVDLMGLGTRVISHPQFNLNNHTAIEENFRVLLLLLILCMCIDGILCEWPQWCAVGLRVQHSVSAPGSLQLHHLNGSQWGQEMAGHWRLRPLQPNDHRMGLLFCVSGTNLNCYIYCRLVI